MNGERVWELRDDLAGDLDNSLDLDPLLLKLLYNRGLETTEAIKEFLDFKLDNLEDPFLLLGMKKAVERIKKAKEKNEKIIIYGDYDADGITSTASLMIYLSTLAIDTDYYIPNRLKEGYGLNKVALRKIIQEQEADLIITVDCGIKAYSEADFLADKGVDLIITDHHTPDLPLPKAVAVINPKQQKCNYPNNNLAGVGLAFKLITALQQDLGDKDYKQFITLATLGTIADIVPLLKENRIITKNGLSLLNNLKDSGIKNYGLQALLEVSGYIEKPITAGSVGYNIAPRLNAAGRMGQAELAVELFLSSSYQEAKQIAKELDKLNNQRQDISQRILAEAEAEIKKCDLTEEWIFVVAGENWHTGVIGNVASDLNEKYHRPVVLISLSDGQGTGSARSIKGYHLYQALKANEELLLAFGGHSQAAGLTIQEEQIAKLRKSLNQSAKKELNRSDLNPRIRLDSEVELKELDLDLVKRLEELEPFGCGNPGPKFLLSEAKIKAFKQVGKDNTHLKLTIQDGAEAVDAIAFSMGDLADLISNNKEVSLVFTPEINSWRGRTKLQLKIRDIKFSGLSFTEQILSKEKDLLAKEGEYQLATRDNYNSIKEITTDNLSLIDKRGKMKSNESIRELLSKKDNGLIYVNDRKESIKLSKELSHNRKEDDLIFYDTALEFENRVRILMDFKSGKYKWLVINNTFDYRLAKSEFEVFLIYAPPLSQAELKKIFALSLENKIKDYYLSYDSSDFKNGDKILNKLYPSRELLAKIYIFFYKLKDDQGLIDKTKAELLRLFKEENNLSSSIETIITALAIFKELGLIDWNQSQQSFQFQARAEDKLDLTSSIRYNEGVKLKEEFAEMKSTLNQELELLVDYLKNEI